MNNITAAIYYQAEDGFGRPWTDAFTAGLRRHGVQTNMFDIKAIKSEKSGPIKDADLHVFWGMRVLRVIEHCRNSGQPIVCLDHGYTEDRQSFTSINLNNLNGRSELCVADLAHDTSRCRQHGWEIKPQRRPGDKIIIAGQVCDDKSLDGTDPYIWANFRIAQLEATGHRGHILFKPHPLEKPISMDRKFEVRAPLFQGSMEEAYAMASIFHTYSSTVGPSAWLNGLPATAASPVSMIFKDQFAPYSEAGRQRWLNDISFRQFNLAEMSSGLAWELLGHRIIGKTPKEIPAMALIDYHTHKSASRVDGVIIVAPGETPKLPIPSIPPTIAPDHARPA